MRTTLTAFLLLPFFVHAQDPVSALLNDHHYFGAVDFESARDSADFAHFRQGLRIEGLALLSDTVLVSYPYWFFERK